jgi:hypothetical protein
VGVGRQGEIYIYCTTSHKEIKTSNQPIEVGGWAAGIYMVAKDLEKLD